MIWNAAFDTCFMIHSTFEVNFDCKREWLNSFVVVHKIQNGLLCIASPFYWWNFCQTLLQVFSIVQLPSSTFFFILWICKASRCTKTILFDFSRADMLTSHSIWTFPKFHSLHRGHIKEMCFSSFVFGIKFFLLTSLQHWRGCFILQELESRNILKENGAKSTEKQNFDQLKVNEKAWVKANAKLVHIKIVCFLHERRSGKLQTNHPCFHSPDVYSKEVLSQ